MQEWDTLPHYAWAGLGTGKRVCNAPVIVRACASQAVIQQSETERKEDQLAEPEEQDALSFPDAFTSAVLLNR